MRLVQSSPLRNKHGFEMVPPKLRHWHGSERRRETALFVEMKITSRPTITARFVSSRVKKSMSAEGKSLQMTLIPQIYRQSHNTAAEPSASK